MLTKDATEGVNIIECDLSIPEKSSKILEKSDVKVKQAENGKYYLPKGKYGIYLKLASKTAHTTIEVK